MSFLVGYFFLIFHFFNFGKSYWHGQVITTIEINEKASQTTSNYAVTFGLVFPQYQLSGGVSVEYNGSPVTTQFDVKRHYEDAAGTSLSFIRYGIISVVLPSVAADSTNTLTIRADSTQNPETGFFTKAEIQATDVNVHIHMNNLEFSGFSGQSISNTYSSLVTPTLEQDFKYWLKGPVATEVQFKDQISNNLNTFYYVRYFRGSDYARISTGVENVESNFIGNVMYTLQIQLGDASPSVVYTKGLFLHNKLARWRKVFWYDNNAQSVVTLPEIQIKYDVNYLISTGHILNYDTSLVVPETTIESVYSNYLGADNDIMGSGTITTYFPQTGGRPDIGPLPTWTVRWLLTMDNRMREKMMSNAELSGSIPIHFRETDSTKSFHGHCISIDDRPTIWFNNLGFQYINTNDRWTNWPTYGHTTNVSWSVDQAHQASFVYIPYLITGDYYFLEEMYYWAGFNLGDSNFDYRGSELGLIKNQVRGDAWAVRNIAHAAAMASDDHIEKAFFVSKLGNNLDYYATDKNDNPLGYWGAISFLPNEGGRPYDDVHSYIGTGSSPWQEDFVLIILSWINDLGFTRASDVMDWFSWFIINRFSHPDFNRFNGADYRLPATYINPETQGSPGGANIPTWLEIKRGIKRTSWKTSIADTCAFCYPQIALAALSTVSIRHIPTSMQAYDWLNANIQMPRDSLNEDPTWAILPKNHFSFQIYSLIVMGTIIPIALLIICFIFIVFLLLIMVLSISFNSKTPQKL